MDRGKKNVVKDQRREKEEAIEVRSENVPVTREAGVGCGTSCHAGP